jgi:hypothetical protein
VKDCLAALPIQATGKQMDHFGHNRTLAVVTRVQLFKFLYMPKDVYLLALNTHDLQRQSQP